METINKALQDFFSLNDNGETSPKTLWAAHKAYIRGRIIQISTQIKQKRSDIIKYLEKEYTTLRASHTLDPSKVSIALLDKAKLDLNLILTTQVEKAIRW